MQKITLIILFCCLYSFSFGQCQSCPAATAPSGDNNSIWIGAVSSDWDNASNWQGGDVPNGAAEDAIINPANYTFAPVISASVVNEPDDVFLINGGVLTIQADFSITDDFTIWGEGSTLNIENGSSASGDDINLCKGGTINLSGGSINNTAGSGELRICTANPTAATSNPSVNVTGGTFSTSETIAGPGNATSSTGNEGDFINVSGGGSFSDPTDATLPVELVAFESVAQGSTNLLKWATASEINNSHFEVQRSYNGQDFLTIGYVGGSGNSNQLLSYTFEDKKPARSTFYRLIQFDFDGEFEIHPTILSKNELVEESFQIRHTNRLSDPIEISSLDQIPSIVIYDNMGRLHFQANDVRDLAIDTNGWNPGIYIIRLQMQDQSVSRKVLLH